MVLGIGEKVKPVIIGSRAMNEWFRDSRRPSGGTELGDWDFLVADRDDMAPYAYNQFRGPVDIFADERLAQWNWSGDFADPSELLTLKISHGMFVINDDFRNWEKHAWDIIFLQKQGATFIRELYDIVQPIWAERYRKNRITLQKSKAEFFADNVVRKYDHDSLHRSVASRGVPMYELILKPGSEVDCDWRKFQALDHDDQILCAQEEVFVTALERILVPKDYHYSSMRAYWWSLMKVCTSLFKNEWALFCLVNLDEMAVPVVDYLALHYKNTCLLELNDAPLS